MNKQSNIKNILVKLKGTKEEELLKQVETSFEHIEKEQKEWYEKSGFLCVDGCGECCRNFEPDLLECEALYMAAWIIENQPEVANDLINGKFPYPRNKGCQFWDENGTYHCSIYKGRAFICRLFGACGSKGKTGETLFKPCKFYPEEKLRSFRIPLVHRQYCTEEIKEIFGVLPPLMSDLMESALSFSPGNSETNLIRDILPSAIRKLSWIIKMNNDVEI